MDKNKYIAFQGFATARARQPVEESEGINTVEFPRIVNGDITVSGGAVSLTEIEVLDLLSEGEIEGLVTGEYDFTNGTVGSVGYNTVPFTAYEDAQGLPGVKFLRSIYWNQVPIVDSQNNFNFSRISVSAPVNGTPNGSVERLKQALTVSRPIGERLRAGTDFIKVYRILNPNCRSVEINVKFGALSMTVLGRAYTPNSTLQYPYPNEVPKVNENEVGDTEQTAVHYTIFRRPLFSNRPSPSWEGVYTEEVLGKISYGYIRNTNIPLLDDDNTNLKDDENFLGWEIKIQRLTPDAISNSIRNTTYVDSITEVYQEIFTYPNSAIVASKFSAEYFAQVPTRAYDCKLLKVKTPSNYNPITKRYTGDWDGSWKTDGDGRIQKEWSDNPAWCFYDLITSKRYGLGKFIRSDLLDKWTLYEIAKYCDTLVPDGYGSFEPRFTCNLVLNSREEAYQVINDFASIFRAMVYYAAGTIYAVQDAVKDAIWQFTNSNVENGDFNYSSSSKRVRHTVAIIRYNDKTNFYKPAVEYVEDIEGIRKYGIREIELTAFGCTSRGQALRLGRWALISEILETESVSFIAGLEGAYIRPGDVFKIFDENRKGLRFGGRAREITNLDSSSIIKLDSEITGLDSSNTYNFSLLTPSFNYDTALVSGDLTSADFSSIRKKQIQVKSFLGSQSSGTTGTDGNIYTEITFTSQFDTGNYLVSGDLIWTMESSGSLGIRPVYDYYRAIKIEEKEDNKYGIVGIQYDEDKFNAIESGLNFEDPEFGQLPPSPNNLLLNVRPITPHSKIIDFSFTASQTGTLTKNFLVYVKTGAFIDADISGATYLARVIPPDVTSGNYFPAREATYNFRVYAVNKYGQRSSSYAGNSKLVTGINPIRDITISSLTIDEDTVDNAAGTRINKVIDNESPTFKWDAGLNVDNLRETITNFNYRVTVRASGTGASPNSHIYLTTGVSTPTFTFNIEDNLAAVSNRGISGAFRNYDVVVEAVDELGNSSAGTGYINKQGYDILGVSNPKPRVQLSSGACLVNDIYCTEQWFTEDGDVRILFTREPEVDDLAGGILYASLQSFSAAEALGKVPTNKTIYQREFSNLTNPLIIPMNQLTGATKAYVALSYYDTFDQTLSGEGVNIRVKQNVSRTVKVNRVGGFNKDDFLFKTWVELQTTGYVYNSAGNLYAFGPSIINDWTDTSAGITSLAVTPYLDTVFQVNNEFGTVVSRSIWKYQYDLYFRTPYADVNYGVLLSAYPEVVSDMKTQTFGGVIARYPVSHVSASQIQYTKYPNKLSIKNLPASSKFFVGTLRKEQ